MAFRHHNLRIVRSHRGATRQHEGSDGWVFLVRTYKLLAKVQKIENSFLYLLDQSNFDANLAGPRYSERTKGFAILSSLLRAVFLAGTTFAGVRSLNVSSAHFCPNNCLPGYGIFRSLLLLHPTVYSLTAKHHIADLICNES